MSFSPLERTLGGAGSLLELATGLGAICRDAPGLRLLDEDPRLQTPVAELRDRVRSIDTAVLSLPQEGSYSYILDQPGVRASVESVEAHNPFWSIWRYCGA